MGKRKTKLEKLEASKQRINKKIAIEQERLRHREANKRIKEGKVASKPRASQKKKWGAEISFHKSKELANKRAQKLVEAGFTQPFVRQVGLRKWVVDRGSQLKTPKKGHKSLSAKQKAALRKAIRANQRMSASAKKKALRKLA